MLVDRITRSELYHSFLSYPGLKGIYYSNESCGVCSVMLPKTLEVFNNVKLPLREISIIELREVAAQQLILQAPTLIIYDGDREIDRYSGFIDLSRIKDQLKKMLS